MEITKRIIYLLQKHVRRELDEQELAELMAWAKHHPAFQQLLEEVSDEKSLASALHAFDQVHGTDLAPGYRTADIQAAVDRYSKAVLKYYSERKKDLYSLHPHWVLAAVGTFGLLQRLNPDVFVDDVIWTDIFSDVDLHMTKNVERF